MKLRDLSDWYKKGVTQEHENQQQIQLRLGTIFKEKEVDIPQAFGSFVNDEGCSFGPFEYIRSRLL